MGPEVLEFLAPVFGIGTVGALILIGMRIRYSHIQRIGGKGTSQKDVDLLTDAVRALHDEVRLLRDDYVGLNERLEFTERLLDRPRGARSESDPPS